MTGEQDAGWFIVAALIFGVLLGGVIAGNVVDDSYEQTLAERGCAYYHPTTGDFTWREKADD